MSHVSHFFITDSLSVRVSHYTFLNLELSRKRPCLTMELKQKVCNISLIKKEITFYVIHVISEIRKLGLVICTAIKRLPYQVPFC